ncbi:hypothetical protein F4778DRAFT_587355 [Xylariomycetidae sp. FL2044]|nr:hypothetical protein F4778DRAFT_587355 [Xylariomycetidae sp. FL2044]
MANNHYYSNSQYGPDLNHKVSSLSDDSSSPGIRGRESLVSLQSFYDSPPPGTSPHEDTYARRSSWAAPFNGGPAGGAYQPVASPSPPTSTVGRFKSFRARLQQPETIHEDESIDMSLLRSASPLGLSDLREEPYTKEPPDQPAEPAFDLTSFSGPLPTQEDDKFLQSLHDAEAGGTFTSGWGAGGETPHTTIMSEELRATSSLTRSLTRSLTMRRSPIAKSSPGLKELGQSEANKRGEVIKVIISAEEEEDASEVDLSSMVGPSPMGMMNPNRMSQSQLSTKAVKTEVFYPQPNWKPFSMRWPYLMGLILLSIVLAICQELLYQHSTQEPLIRFKASTEIGSGYYFAFKFLPTIITVTFGVLWQNTDFEVKRVEAFYQMSRVGGALAAESINVDYITQFNLTRPLQALRRKHYAVAVSSVATLLAISLVPTLGSAALELNPSRAERLKNPEVEKTITINATLSRLLTVTLFAIASLGIVLFYQLTARRSGLLADVKGIAGLASMAVSSHIMMDFRDMDTATPQDIHRQLKNHRYTLRNSSLASDKSALVTQEETDRYKDAHLAQNPHPLMLRAGGSIPFIGGIALFLAFIPLFLFTPARAVTDRAPWLVTLFAVCIKMGWGSLDTSIRMLEPYYILSRRHAPARTLALDYTALPFAIAPARAFLNRHWMVFCVGLGAVLAETLTIFATSLATVDGRDFLDLVAEDDDFIDEGLNAGQETARSFVITLALAAAVLLYLGAVATAVFLRRRHPFLPRQPNSIASVLAFLHQSKMLPDFVGTAKLTNAQMRDLLDSSPPPPSAADAVGADADADAGAGKGGFAGKTYGLGWFVGRDGLTHCGVDEEELTGNYKHGIDYSKGNNPWSTEWALW